MKPLDQVTNTNIEEKDGIVYTKHFGQVVACEIYSVKKTILGKRYIVNIPYKNGSRDLVKRMWWRLWL